MKYYVIYRDNSAYETVTFEKTVDAIGFIEKKINEENYFLEDFRVIHGTEPDLKVIETPIRILMS